MTRDQDPHQWPQELAQRLREALSLPVDVKVLWGTPSGAGRPPEGVPALAHYAVHPDGGVQTLHAPTPAGGTARPDTPHSAKQSQEETMTNATPAQLRDAWLSLEAGLELTLTTTRENARAQASMTRDIQRDTGHQASTPPEEWDATAWAAQKLLDALKALPEPQLPPEPDPGQADILEELERPSTPGDKPGENVFPLRKGHW